MKERPIIFSGAMVRAILDRRKSQTRRVIKNHPLIDGGFADEFIKHPDNFVLQDCPYGVPGDRLYVKETFQKCGCRECAHEWPRKGPHGIAAFREGYKGPSGAAWTPSIFMPRWASRITLEITGVRVQRLQEISEEDAMAEGISLISPGCYGVFGTTAMSGTNARDCFSRLWDSINAKRGFGWEANRFVRAISFQRVQG